jgi:hypothetical protein
LLLLCPLHVEDELLKYISHDGAFIPVYHGAQQAGSTAGCVLWTRVPNLVKSKQVQALDDA